jgi:hypothetical protein
MNGRQRRAVLAAGNVSIENVRIQALEEENL